MSIFLCSCGRIEDKISETEEKTINEDQVREDIIETEEEATEIIDGFDADIPKLSGSYDRLALSEEELKRKVGYNLSGPSSSYCSIMNDLFCLDNTDRMNCYVDASMTEYYAVDNGEVVVFGISSVTVDADIKDFIKSDELSIEPISYMVKQTSSGNYLASYLWAIDNGYLSIIACPMQGCDYYNLPMYTLAYVKDLKYLGYLNHNQLDIHNYGKVISK